MNHRNDGIRRDEPSGREYGQGGGMRGASRQSGQYGSDDPSNAGRGQQSQTQNQTNRSAGEYYGEAQFGERTQGTGWNNERGDWDYEGGPERYGASGYGETSQRDYRPGSAQRDYSNQASTSDYSRSHQGYGAQGSFGNEYRTDDRSQGYGEASSYRRTPQSRWQGSQHSGQQSHERSGRHGREGYGDRSSLSGSSQGYPDEGEMSGYGAREFGAQQHGSSRPARYGASPGQYGGYGAGGGYRGVGPKNYKRSDERMTEDINERLTDDDDLDASNISVRVSNGKVTLEGFVDQRWMKHRAEDVVESCTGVTDIDNRIQVTSLGSRLGQVGETKASASHTVQATSPGTSSNIGSSGVGGTASH